IIIDALKRASAGSIVAVTPYFGYARQDRKGKPRTPISAKLCTDLVSTAAADRAVAIDLDAGQIQGFAAIPVDHPFAIPVQIEPTPLAEVVVSDTIPLRPATRAALKIKQLTVARLLGEAIKRIHHGDAISSLFI